MSFLVAFLVACISCCTDQKWSNSKAPAPSIPVSIRPLEIPLDPKSIQFGILTHGGVKKPVAAAANKWSLDAALASAKLMEPSGRHEEGLLVGYRRRAFGWGLRRQRMVAVLADQSGMAP
jgi:hypothetical protein